MQTIKNNQVFNVYYLYTYTLYTVYNKTLKNLDSIFVL